MIGTIIPPHIADEVEEVVSYSCAKTDWTTDEYTPSGWKQFNPPVAAATQELLESYDFIMVMLYTEEHPTVQVFKVIRCMDIIPTRYVGDLATKNGYTIRRYIPVGVVPSSSTIGTITNENFVFEVSLGNSGTKTFGVKVYCKSDICSDIALTIKVLGLNY